MGAAAGAVATAGVVGFSPAVGPGSAQAQAPRLLAPNAVNEGAASIPDLVERVAPSVVTVMVEREVERPRIPDPFQEFFRFRFGEPFEDDRFGPRGGPGQDDEEGDAPVQRLQAQGSGFFVDAEGHIVTNNHVVSQADVVRVRLNSGEELDAEVVGADPLTDLAVLKVEPPKGQAFVRFADNVNLRVGETVVAVGNPFGLGGTVTSGIVSAIGGENRQQQFLDYIQIDAPINRGNSGGPTFDLKGRVVGVNVAILSPNGGSVGIGFAIPAKTARATVDQLIKSGAVTRGWLGVALREVDTTLAAALERDDTKGAFVNEALDGTPAEKAGLRAGDLIIAVNGREVADTVDLSRTVSAFPPGEKIRVTFVRDGDAKTIPVTLGERDADSGAPDAAGPDDEEESPMEESLGLQVSSLNDAMRARFRVSEDVKGVVVTRVQRGGEAANAGLRPGVVILAVDGDPVANPKALSDKVDAAVKAGKEAVLLRVQRGQAKEFAALPIGGEG
ncbi:MAG: Do family serine endopeptidase [Parvularculaceae bacterium]